MTALTAYEAHVVPENVIQVEMGVSSRELALPRALEIGECVQNMGRCCEKIIRFEWRARTSSSDGQHKRMLQVLKLPDDTDDADRQPSGSRSPWRGSVAQRRVQQVSFGPAISALAHDDSSRSTLEESATSAVR